MKKKDRKEYYKDYYRERGQYLKKEKSGDIERLRKESEKTVLINSIWSKIEALKEKVRLLEEKEKPMISKCMEESEQVDSLTTDEEMDLYAGALYHASKWHPGDHEKNDEK